MTQLRRYRGLWLLAVFALMFKLVGGSLCAADGVSYDTQAQRSAVVQAAADVAGDDGDCLLGEGGACHCACTHAVPLPTMVTFHLAAEVLPSELPAAASGYRAEPTASLLRPPIAA